MIQLFLLIASTFFIWIGIRGALGWENHKGVKTTPAVTAACFVIAAGLIGFALLILPMLAL